MIFGIGFSAGANSMMNYAYNSREQCKLKAVVSISNPFDLWESSQLMDKSSWINRLYAKFMV